jgi:formylglycine-generating enzyme required for sulfatase activity
MKNLLFTFFILLSANSLFANNLAISAPVYSAETLTFTISWDNSWNISSGPANHDAVWLFIKRQKCTGNNDWVHQLVSATTGDHNAKVSAVTSTVVSVIPSADGVGVFIKRIGTNVVGNVGSQTISLKLANTNPSITTTSSDNFKVIGFEMVYVTQGDFFIGDGRTTALNGAFCDAGSTSPKRITSAIQASGLGAASNYTSSNTTGCSMPLPATFPLGVNGFYCMKYELLQGVFVEYLNTLNYDQQALRLRGGLPNQTGSNWYNWGSLSSSITTIGTYNTKSAVFATSFPYLPQGALNWQDITSVLDWSGLRPMTEFEYEKACRGNNGGTPNAPIAFEYPWGNTTLTGGNNGNYYNYQTGATATWSIYEGACRYWEDNGPIRAGFASTSNSNRSQSGATYYGIMEMAGNLMEQCVGGGAGYDYSGFTTANGDGVISETGLANVIGWPPNGGIGTILKGGSFRTYGNFYDLTVSDRSYHAGTTRNTFYGTDHTDQNGNNAKPREIGGRGVRTF